MGDIRIRINLINTLQIKFQTVTDRYYASQLEYNNEIRKIFTSRIRTVKPEATQAEINNIILSHDFESKTSEDVVKNIILKVLFLYHHYYYYFKQDRFHSLFLSSL